MAATQEQKKNANLYPPEEVFWQKYSPHHECLLSWVGSFTVHVLVVGLVILAALMLMWARENELNRPPRMDVVMLEGGGDGFEGEGSMPGGPVGQPNKANQTEAVENQHKSDGKIDPQNSSAKLNDLPKVPQLDVPATSEIDVGEAPADIAIQETLQKVRQEADLAVKQAMKIQAPAGNPNGSGTKVGSGGQGGLGNGPGKGTKGKGLGTGPPGRKATKQEILAWRWRFDLTGEAKEHADKLDAVGVTLAIQDPNGRFRVIRDLKRRPVDARFESLERYKDAVTWYNTRAESIFGLAKELQLPFVPRFVALLLPKEREEKMAEVERRYAESQGRKLNTIRATWFDFRLQNGSFEPVVIRQE